ncbi:hypothetical protein P5E45_09165 [Clostridium perfringens]|uniref:hypothetical protein n=1 Tax=Clostridium perfringens TaxID=1502 RepID=UPI0018E409F2|nr:hypothetical protein [Clostridium perfringens]MBI5999103.1 hypothetical protein [Clostridium perfringens]MDK0784810.1 hypothetical protein [Clostridium perfringens]MDK0790526.1 hypothetical protein [Clostridium perfringens]MDZ4963173.1 hypothetical protein [Clostridium perfringens]MDZ5012840.1 hypothetical protein [Clostridium perfringens]
MKKDKNFKKTFKIKGFIKKPFSGTFYNPDLYFENGKEAIWIEHSSTGDRKVHIGELCQFMTVPSILAKNMILILDGKSKSAPTPIGERDRLKYYIRAFDKSLIENVNFIGVIKNKDDINNLSFHDLKNKCKIIYQKK